MIDIKTAIEANRKAWDMSAEHHRKSPLWRDLVKDVQLTGFTCFDATISDALRALEPAGKSVVQIGCNNGREVFSLASFDVKNALGIDQSADFIAQAQELKNTAPQPADFLCADIYNLPSTTPKEFNIALITIGVLNWMPDLPQFFKIIAGLLASGGMLLIYETHPFLEMFDPNSEDPKRPTISYFRDQPFIEQELITYDGSKPDGGVESHWFTHSIGTIMNAILAAGLKLRAFNEYPHCNREVDYEIYEKQTAQLPLCYVLTAQKS